MKLYITILLTLIFCLNFSAQSNETSIHGKVIESNNNPIPFSTVLIKDYLTSKLITGTTTDEKGEFKITTTAKKIYIEISFIGFLTHRIDSLNLINSSLELGTIILNENVSLLDEVSVEAEQSQTIFKLDKRVFNVGKDLTSTGASALEVLNNVPSVNVNIEGQISLRGSQGVQILINGKPSVLASEEGNALGSITADMIEKVEVITNPSAKYDAEGTSGILNIILKKTEKRGLNGSVTLNTGIPNNHSIGLSLNRRTEKVNLFSQIGFGKRTMLNNSNSTNLNKLTDTTLSIIGNSDKNETFFNLILGMDYHFNKLNVLTISGHYAYEKEIENSSQDYTYSSTLSTSGNPWNRAELTNATNPKWEYEVQYKKDFKKNKKQNLLLSATGDSFSKNKSSDFTNTYNNINTSNTQQQASTDFKEFEYAFKLDYTHPFSKKITLESGAQYLINTVSNTYEVLDFISNAWITNNNFNNTFHYDQRVLAAYSTLAYELEKWGIKGGLRLENTNLSTELVNNNENNNTKYSNLFPSIHSSYKINEKTSIQAGYSKRIFRPRLWDLNPFTSFRDNFNISTGNPNLNPQFSHSFEINNIYSLKKTSFNIGIYHKRTSDVIEDVIYFENNISTSQPENIGTNNSTGIEINAKYTPKKWISFTGEVNYNSFVRRGEFNSTNFDFNGNRWFSKLSSRIKLFKSFTVEVSGNYNSKYQTVQYEYSDNIFMNLGVRKKLLKGRLNANLSIRDVFASRYREYISNQDTFHKYSFNKRGRYISFGISFGFGKGEAMEFSGQKQF